MNETDKPAPHGDNAALIAELRDGLRSTETTDAGVDLYDIEYANDLMGQAAAALEAADARVKELEAEKERDREQRFKDAFAYIDNQKAAAGRYGLEPGMLQMAWRNGERSDAAELEWAIVDALAMGGVTAYPGDGVACAAHIVRKQIELREAAERQLAEAREACAKVKERCDDCDGMPNCFCAVMNSAVPR